MNRKHISDDEARELLAGYLGAFAAFCQTHGLKYFLCGGTLLGAVRHRGFIPWDDDIDVAMPRPDYEQFLRLAQRQPVSENLKLIVPGSCEYCLWPFAKLTDTRTRLVELMYRRKFTKKMREGYGLYIDIFPLDGLPESREEQARYFKKIHADTKGLQRATYHISDVKPLPRRLFRMLVLPFYALLGYRWFLRRLDAMARRFDYEKSSHVAAVFGSYGIREAMEKACFESAVKVVFEGREYDAPVGYDRYLSSLYGDYMQLPPEPKRVTHHLRELYWKQ